MSTLIIRKKSLKTWLHTDSILGDFIISKFYFNADNVSFQIVEQGQSRRVIYNITDITLYAEPSGGTAETFTTITELSLRLEELNYPAFQYDGQITSIANLIDAGTNITITGDGTAESPYIINSTGGSGSQTLAEVLVEGNITDGTDISISDGDKILLDNGANLKKGTTDAGLGGSKGIALRCAVDYELKWEAGRLYVMGGDGFTIREVSHNFTTTPTVNDDDTKGFVIDSRWILDNGDVYVCTDDTTGAAVWVLQSSGIPTLQQVLEEGDNATINGVGDLSIIYADGTLSSEIYQDKYVASITSSTDTDNISLIADTDTNIFLTKSSVSTDLKIRVEEPTGVAGEIIIKDPVSETETVAFLSDITTPTLQEVLDNNHDLVDGNNFQGTSAGIDNTGGQVNAFGSNAALENTGNNINALGDAACAQNSGSAVNALGDSSAQQNTGNNVNTLGYYSGSGNTGNEVNALGSNAANNNTGENVNALGNSAGLVNSFNNVNLFGNSATADEDGQTVLSKDGTIMARISTTDLTDTRKYNLPDADGTLALTTDIPTLQEVTTEGNVSSNDIQVTLGSSSAYLRSDSLKVDDGTPNSIVVTGNKIVFTKTEQLDLTTPTFTAPRTQTFQNASGTIALLSDITGGGGGGGASVSFYLNGSVSQGTIGGVAFREMDRTPILGTGTDFTINADGYIQSFITDTNVPNQLEIPAGNWNFETYFSASSGGGSPSFYVELYKWNGTTLSLIASNSATPRLITDGTNIEAYFSALAVPQTTLLATDRLAIRIYVTHSGRTITLHTENSHLCQVITTFSTGLTALNGLTAQVQNLAVGTSGTDFAISSATDTHTFNLPTASATNRGALSSTDWSTFNGKQDTLVSATNIKTINGSTILGSGDLVVGGSSSLTVGTTPITSGTIGRVFFQGSGNVLQQSASLFWDNTNSRLGVGATPATTVRLDVRAQGALSTDIAFRVRNSADSANLVDVRGNGNVGIGNKTFSTYSSGGATPNDCLKLELTSDGAVLGVQNSNASGFSGVEYLNQSGAARVFTGFNNSNGQEFRFNNFASGGYIDFLINATSALRIANSRNILLGTPTDIASSKLTIESTTQGFLPPRMTTTQKNAIASPAAGLVVYDSTLGKLCVRTASAWETITSI